MMRLMRWLVAGALGWTLMGLPAWGAAPEAAQPPATEAPKLQVSSETKIDRPELHVVTGIKGWRVNGEEIPVSAIHDMALTYNGPYLLQDLVVRKLLEQAAKAAGITVTEAEVDAQLKALREQRGLTDDEPFNRFLQSERVTLAGYRDMTRTLVYVQKVLGKDVAVTEEEITQTYTKGQNTLYRAPDTVTFRLAGGMNEKAVAAAAAEAKRGKTDFMTVAKNLATNETDRRAAGEEITYSRGDPRFPLPPELEGALFVAPLNQVVGPIRIQPRVTNPQTHQFQLPPSWVFFRVEKKTDAYQFSLDQVREAIREGIRDAKIQRAWPAWLKEHLAGAEITPLKAD